MAASRQSAIGGSACKKQCVRDIILLPMVVGLQWDGSLRTPSLAPLLRIHGAASTWQHPLSGSLNERLAYVPCACQSRHEGLKSGPARSPTQVPQTALGSLMMYTIVHIYLIYSNKDREGGNAERPQCILWSDEGAAHLHPTGRNSHLVTRSRQVMQLALRLGRP